MIVLDLAARGDARRATGRGAHGAGGTGRRASRWRRSAGAGNGRSTSSSPGTPAGATSMTSTRRPGCASCAPRRASTRPPLLHLALPDRRQPAAATGSGGRRPSRSIRRPSPRTAAERPDQDAGTRRQSASCLRCPTSSAPRSSCATTTTCREDEVAAILDVPRGTVKSRLHHGDATPGRTGPRAARSPVTCDELLDAWLGHGDLPPGGAEHLATCPSCQQDAEAVTALSSALRAHAAPAPPPWLSRTVLRSAAPLLAARAEPVPRPAWRAARDRAPSPAAHPGCRLVSLVRGDTRAALGPSCRTRSASTSPRSYAVLLALLLGLTYAAVPLLAARQLRPPLEEHHA